MKLKVFYVSFICFLAVVLSFGFMANFDNDVYAYLTNISYGANSLINYFEYVKISFVDIVNNVFTNISFGTILNAIGYMIQIPILYFIAFLRAAFDFLISILGINSSNLQLDYFLNTFKFSTFGQLTYFVGKFNFFI